MKNRITTLYILSISAIIAFLGMQIYWLHSRYEYSLDEYENRTRDIIEKTLVDYNKLRSQRSLAEEDITTTQTVNNLNLNLDSSGKHVRTATVTTRIFNGRKLLGIKDKRKLTGEEIDRLDKLVRDSLATLDSIKATFDATNAPSDGAAWNGMHNFELEIRSPFTASGIDSLLRKEYIDAMVTLTVSDSMMWKPMAKQHTSIINPHFTMVIPYSELEKKSVVIDCNIPSSEVISEMGWTLVLAIVISLFLIACLVWQIKTIARLTRLDKIRNMFVTTMIHELKRPISTLKICVSGMENDSLMEDTCLRKEVAGEIRMTLDNLSAYFSRLRDITFNNVDQIPLNVTSFHLAELVDSVLVALTIPSTKQVIFENEVSGDTMISADRSHLSNILTNLIENAVKYSGDEVTVKISATMADNSVAIDIADNGIGIPDTDKTKIFTRFYRGYASATDIPGMGLGLAYVKLLTEAHSGEISVRSSVGAGSTFTIKLPQ